MLVLVVFWERSLTSVDLAALSFFGAHGVRNHIPFEFIWIEILSQNHQLDKVNKCQTIRLVLVNAFKEQHNRLLVKIQLQLLLNHVRKVRKSHQAVSL